MTNPHSLEQPWTPMHFHRANKAILFVDVVESVRMMEHDEVGALSQWLRLVERVKAGIVKKHAGRLVKNLGDGMLLEFENVQDAVGAALEVQELSKKTNADLPPARQMLLRMSVDAADVIVHGEEIYGQSINLAARLLKLAGAGEIVTSARALDQLTPVLDADVEDLGECYLRHLKEPVRAYRIGAPGPHPVVRSYDDAGGLSPTIAVIPLAHRQIEADHIVFGEVVAEEIIKALSLSPDLNVISRLSTTAFRGRSADLPQIVAHFAADYILSGVYDTDDRHADLYLELAEGKQGQIVWTKRIQGRINDVLHGDQDVVSQIVAEVGLAITSQEIQRSQSQPLPTLKSYTLLIAAIAMMHRLSWHDFEEARRLLETLVERRTRQAIPQAWLAKWYVLRVQQGWSEDGRQDTYRAQECAKRALDADPDCSLALAMDGIVHTNLLKDLDTAEDRYERAIECNPNDSQAWLLKGTLHAFKGEGDQAVADTQHALRLTPLDPHRYFYDSLASTASLAAHRYSDALRLARRSFRANRTHTSTLRVMAAAQWNLGRRDEARKTARKLMELEPDLTVSGWLARSPSAPYRTGKEWSEVLREVGIPD